MTAGGHEPHADAAVADAAAADAAAAVTEDAVTDWSELVPKRAYVLRSPEGEELLSTYGGPGETEGSAVFFAHAPDRDGEFAIVPGDGWSVLRSVAHDA